jgi:hypothetical protein
MAEASGISTPYNPLNTETGRSFRFRFHHSSQGILDLLVGVD